MNRALCLITLAALFARAAVAIVVDRAAADRGQLCLFDDTRVYWQLASNIVQHKPFVVDQFGVPHWTLRTPGYPAFLAIPIALFGNHTLPARLLQSALGALAVPLAFAIAKLLQSGTSNTPNPKFPIVAATLVAFEPYTLAASAFLLSEALTIPLLLLSIVGLAALILKTPSAQKHLLIALLTGIAVGATILTRPSLTPFFLLAAPATLLASTKTKTHQLAAPLALAAGALLLLAPWWIRNHQRTGHFVPTALWLGASLYDGLNPHATGASDMTFLEQNDLKSLPEFEQDRTLTSRALDFLHANPKQALILALVKSARFWSPWPNAAEFASPWLAIPCAIFTIPLYMLILNAIASRKIPPLPILLLLAPLLTTALLHTLFVGSLRYRVPVMPPAIILAAFALTTFPRFPSQNPSPPNPAKFTTPSSA